MQWRRLADLRMIFFSAKRFGAWAKLAIFRKEGGGGGDFKASEESSTMVRKGPKTLKKGGSLKRFKGFTSETPFLQLNRTYLWKIYTGPYKNS